MKRRARDLLTDPALRARVLAGIVGEPAPRAPRAAVAAPSAPAVHVIEIIDPYRPVWERPWFAVFFTTVGAVLGGWLLGLS